MRTGPASNHLTSCPSSRRRLDRLRLLSPRFDTASHSSTRRRHPTASAISRDRGRESRGSLARDPAIPAPRARIAKRVGVGPSAISAGGWCSVSRHGRSDGRRLRTDGPLLGPLKVLLHREVPLKGKSHTPRRPVTDTHPTQRRHGARKPRVRRLLANLNARSVGDRVPHAPSTANGRNQAFAQTTSSCPNR
jgi:hypothetical protein